jgi:hypothetical protein
VVGNLLAAAILAYPLFYLPSGSGVRLLGESFHSALFSLAAFILVLVLGIIALWRERYRLFAVVGLFLSLTPFFFAGWVMRYIANIRHIVLEP